MDVQHFSNIILKKLKLKKIKIIKIKIKIFHHPKYNLKKKSSKRNPNNLSKIL